MKILSLNCNLVHWKFHHSKKIKQLLEKIVALHPDMICLQEVFFKRDAKKITNYLEKEGYKYFYHTKNLLTVSKHKISNKGFKIFEKQGKLFSYSYLDVLYRKAFQYFFLEKNKVFIVNTHMLSGAGERKSHYGETRKLQILEILRKVKEKKKVIILGDFNFTQKSKPHEITIKDGFKAASRNIKKSTFPEGRVKIDHIFTKGIKKTRTKIVNVGTSTDHRGLIINF
jgi:exonuclease III